VSTNVEVPSGEIPAMGSPDAPGSHAAEGHTAPRTVID
jgi:hypothetical protein